MGMSHSTYFAYGLEIPTAGPAWQEAEHLEQELPKHKDRCPDVGFLQAGDYDQDMFFLVTDCQEIELGTYGRTNTATTEQRANWDIQLANAVHALGYSDTAELPAPGWIAVPDCS